MNKLSGKSLLTLELVILLAFFLFGAVTCAVIFVKADNKADDAKALENAVVRTTSIAETLKAVDGDLAKTGNRIAGRSSYDTTEDKLLIYFDEDMQPTSQSRSVFTAQVTSAVSGKCRQYHIEFLRNKDKSSVYSLDFKGIREGGSN